MEDKMVNLRDVVDLLRLAIVVILIFVICSISKYYLGTNILDPLLLEAKETVHESINKRKRNRLNRKWFNNVKFEFI